MDDVGGVSPGAGRPSIFCTICLTTWAEPGASPRVTCPGCGSLDRHRLLLPLILAVQASLSDRPMLDVAPHAGLTRSLRDAGGRRLITIDRDPNADGREVDLIADATGLPFPDGHFGMVLYSHVLEHIPDDRAAMVELARVLHQEAPALILTPRRSGALTEEDPLADEEQRVRRFGQADHVRLYGDDLEERLESCGLRVTPTRASTFLPHPLLELIGVRRDIQIWLAATGKPPTPPDPAALVEVVANRALLATAALHRRVADTSAEVELWKSRYGWLESRPIVRWGRRMKNLLGR